MFSARLRSAPLALVTFALAICFAAPAFAQSQDRRMAGEVVLPPGAVIGLVEGVNLMVNDDVTGGCWTNPVAVENAMRAQLAQGGIEVSESNEGYGFSPMRPHLEVSIAGQRLEGGCLISAQMMMYFTNNTQLVFAEEDAIASVRTQRTNIMWINTQAMAAGERADPVVAGWSEQALGALIQQIRNARSSSEVRDAYRTWGFSGP